MESTNANDPLRTTNDEPSAGADGSDHTADFAHSLPSADGDTAGFQPSDRQMEPRVSASVVVPGYEIEKMLGRGGMGVVYKARDLKLKRTVALKMVLAGGHAGPGDLARFRIEAQAVARLSHPNIVQIYEVGEADGRPYCALEFVEGGNLAGKLNGQPMPAREAAKLVETLARAMQLAHSRNVVHRDLKPANVLLTVDGTPKITDFGLARQMDSDSGETQAGAVMGTPSYMAPEQAAGHAHEAGPAADIYALGAILYDCLTGRPPFKGSTMVGTLDQVRTQEPKAPSRWQAGVPLDLETICLKCLRKEPENRYASAAELADELVRYQKGEPILARRVGAVKRAVKWVKRHRTLTASLAGFVGIIVAAFVLVSWSYFEAENARQKAQQNERAERWGRYRSNIAAASAAMQLQNSDAARSALEEAPPEHRNWEWHQLYSQLDGASLVMTVPGGKIRQMVLSPLGRQIAVCCIGHNDVYLLDMASGRVDAVLRGHSAAATSVTFRPDGKQLATAGNDQTIRLWDPATGHQTALLGAEVDPAHPDRYPTITYNSDGSRFVTSPGEELGSLNSVVGGAGMSRLWDATSGKEIAGLGKWQEFSASFAFSPDGKRLAVGSRDFVLLCDAVTGQQLSVLGPHRNAVRSAVYSPDGKRIASIQKDKEADQKTPATALAANAIHLWDGVSGKKVHVLSGHTNLVTSAQFSPDGSRFVSASDYPENSARLWDVATGQLLEVLAGHKNNIGTAVFSPDGTRLVTASSDQTARLWDGRTGKLLAVLDGHTAGVRHVVFNPNSTRVVTASEDATISLWDAHNGKLIAVLRGHSDGFHFDCPPVFTPDGSRLVSGSIDGSVRVWDINLLERSGILNGHTSYVYDVAFSPDGEQVASAAWDGSARLWDATTCRQTGLLKYETKIISSVAYSPDGGRLATLERQRGVKLWDVASPQKPRDLPFLAAKFAEGGRAAFNPAGTLLAAGTVEGPVRLWDAATGRELGRLEGHDNASLDVTFDPDGRLLASAGLDGTVRLWDVTQASKIDNRNPSFPCVAVLRGHTSHVWRVAFSTDGKLLASGSHDKTIRLWDTQTHEELKVMQVGSAVYCVAFSPDDRRLAAGCRDNTVRLYDVARRQQVAELRGHTDYVHAVAWSPDGTRLVSGSGDFTVRVWDSLSVQERAKRSFRERFAE